MRDTEFPANFRDALRLRTTVRAQAVIDRRRLDLARTRRRGEEQQGHAVGAARYGNADSLAWRAQRVEIGAKSVN
jgi:hypothetical protein